MSQNGFLLVIDGPSAVGKSTVISELLRNTDMKLEIARRITTRERRDTAEDRDSYEFVSHEMFRQMVDNNELIEHKCYKFGMCYGLPKAQVLPYLEQSKHLIGMINLGNISQVKKAVPNSYGVLLSASLETIQQRLEARGTHTIEQIEERLENASLAHQFQSMYDLVVQNEACPIEETIDKIIQNFKAAMEM